MRDHLLKFIQTSKSWDMLSTIGCFYNLLYGYGSIPIDTFLVGWTSIYQLFWGSLGIKVLTHCHIITVNTGLFRVGFCSMGGIPTSDLRLDPVGPSSWPFTFRNRKMFRKINGSTHGRKVAPKKMGYLLVNIQKAIENHHLFFVSSVNQLFLWAIFYVANCNKSLHHCRGTKRMGEIREIPDIFTTHSRDGCFNPKKIMG